MRYKNYTRTHRCEESLKRWCSIRLEKWPHEKEAVWRLSQRTWNDYGDWCLGESIDILYCPFCGLKLPVEDQKEK